MNIDLTNGDILDNTPLVERKSNVVSRINTMLKENSTGIVPRKIPVVLPKIQQPVAQTQSYTPRPVAPVSSVPTASATPITTPEQNISTEKESEKPITDATSTETPKSETKKSMFWVIGAIAGGIIGYFYGKKMNSALIGAGIGGGAGFVYDKMQDKKDIKTKSTTDSAKKDSLVSETK
jgi:hypothetical protein